MTSHGIEQVQVQMCVGVYVDVCAAPCVAARGLWVAFVLLVLWYAPGVFMQGIFVNQARIDMKNDYLVKELAMHKVFTCLRSLMMNQEKIFHMQLRKNFATG